MPERVRARFRKLRKAVRKLDTHSSMDAYHLVRRRAKQLRYSIECGAGLFGKPAESMLRALRRLQDGLGAQQDAHMAKSRLAVLAADGGLPPETLFLMGRLAEHHLAATREVRKTLTRAWRKASGRRWKALCTRMQELSDAASGEPPAPRETVVVAPSTRPSPCRRTRNSRRCRPRAPHCVTERRSAHGAAARPPRDRVRAQRTALARR